MEPISSASLLSIVVLVHCKLDVGIGPFNVLVAGDSIASAAAGALNGKVTLTVVLKSLDGR